MSTEGNKTVNLIAKVISAVSMPNFIPLFCYPALRGNDPAGAFWILLITIATVPMALTLLYWKVAKMPHGFAPNRKSRYVPFAIAIVLGLLAWLWLDLLYEDGTWEGARLLLAIYGAGLGLGLLVTLFWKVSLHMVSAAVFALLPLMLFETHWSAVLFLALIPLIAWARMHLKSHDIWQIVVGLFLGFASILIAMFAVAPQVLPF